jgi:hypothetical protein
MTDAKAIETAALRVGLSDDNPAEQDLLGFDVVVAPIVAALRLPNLDPVTIGVQAPWGGGKSTLLGLLERELKGRTIVIRTNPWEYDDQFDVKGTLIAEVLTRLQQEVENNETLNNQVTRLFKRVSWSRVGIAVARGLITAQWDPDQLVDAFNPQNQEGPRSLAAFRDDFSDLVSKMPDVDRVIVLVDDLDRCLPPAVLATLEAIKLFLSVKGMAFVIAADQDMIKASIAASLSASNRSEEFAKRYLEKIVQLPVALPRLSEAETEVYIVLLLAVGAADYWDLVRSVRERRAAHQVPLVDTAAVEIPGLGEIVSLAAQIAEGLSPTRRGNPREIKRFLNAFGIRSSIADARGVTLAPAVVVKLLLLEEQHQTEFEHLVGLGTSDRKEYLAAWEAWAREGKTAPLIKGMAVSDATKPWAAADPRLADEDLDRYVSLAASLAASSVRGGMSDEHRELVRELIGDSDANRDEAVARISKLPIEDQRAIVEALLAESRKATSVVNITNALVGLGKAETGLVGDIAAGIRSRMWRRLEEACAVRLAKSGVGPFGELARAMSTDGDLDASVREAAKQAIGA